MGNTYRKPPFYLSPSKYKVRFYLRDQRINDQVTHPDIIKFEKGFKVCSQSYKYIMAMTPYPYYDERYENPYIVASNDEDSFYEDCIPNPIEPYPGEGYHNSDPDIVYARDSFYLFWRLRHIQSNKAYILVKKSSDLINWSEKKVIHIQHSLLSPAIIYDIHEGKWKMWGVDENSWYVVYYESIDGVRWEFVAHTNIPRYLDWLNLKLHCWHLDVNKTRISKQYLALIVYASGPANAGLNFLFFGESYDGIEWKVYKEPILSPTPHSWQSHKIYRSTFIIEKGKIKVWYSASSEGTLLRKLNIKILGRKLGVGKWGIGYTEYDLKDYVYGNDTTLNVIL